MQSFPCYSHEFLTKQAGKNIVMLRHYHLGATMLSMNVVKKQLSNF